MLDYIYKAMISNFTIKIYVKNCFSYKIKKKLNKRPPVLSKNKKGAGV